MEGGEAALLNWWCGETDLTGVKDEPHKYTLKTVDEPFSYEVSRADGTAIWNTTGHHMLFKDQYLELTTHMHPKSTLYGLGERISSAGAALVKR